MKRPATVVGYTLAVAALAIGCHITAAPAGLWHPMAILVVIAGAVGYALLSSPPGALLNLRRTPPSVAMDRCYLRLVELAAGYRRHGARWLEEELRSCRHPLELHGLRLLTVDTDRVELEASLRRLAGELEAADRQLYWTWQQLACGAVNTGVIATLAGMSQALLHVPEGAAAALAGAFLATAYGLAVGHLVCAPQAAARRRAQRRATAEREAWIEGLILIQCGMHPRLLAERLSAHRLAADTARAA